MNERLMKIIRKATNRKNLMKIGPVICEFTG